MKNNFVKWVGFISIMAIIVVFLFYGVYSGSQTTQGVAFWVNGEAVLEGDFRRELEQRTQIYQRMNFPASQLKSMGLEKQVYETMLRTRLLLQGAKELDIVASSEAVRKAIVDIPAFQIDGKFDLIQYEKLLTENRMNPGTFESKVRDDLTSRGVQEYFGQLVFVSDAEAEDEYVLSGDKRKLRYVIVSPENVQKKIKITDAEVKNFLADAGNLEMVKKRFETFKDTKYKNVTFEKAQADIASELILPTKTDEVKKVVDQIASRLAQMLDRSESSKKAVNTYLKEFGLSVQDTIEWVTKKSSYVSGIGSSDELLKALFDPQSPKRLALGSKPQSFDVARGVVVAVVVESEAADLAKLTEDERAKTKFKLKNAKSNQMVAAWLDSRKKKSKIEVDKRIVPGV